MAGTGEHRSELVLAHWQADAASAGGNQRICVRRHRGPGLLDLPKEDARPDGPDSREPGKSLPDPTGVAVTDVAQPAQVALPVGDGLGCGAAEHCGSALVVAPVVASAKRVHPVLPAGVSHGGRGAVPGGE